MQEVKIKAYAKINLSIDVLGKRPDGYHEVLMVMEQVDLYDDVKVIWTEEALGSSGNEPHIQITLNTNIESLPVDSTNIAYKAAVLMVEKYGQGKSGQIKIEIEKRIPIAAGMAGGSANGAAVLHGINKLWNMGLGLEELFEMAKQLGADVSFCLAGQAALNKQLNLENDKMAGTCALASGIGEKLQILPPLRTWVLLSKPSIGVSTAQVYGGLDIAGIKEHPNTEELVLGLRECNYYKISKNMTNVLENYTLKEYPIIMYTKNKMGEEGHAYKVLMSGSGPTVFGLYTNRRKGVLAYRMLKQLNKETFFTKTL